LRRYLVVLVVVLCLGVAFAQPGGKAPVDYVKPNIGGIGILLQPTEPFVQLPFSMARLAPAFATAMSRRVFTDSPRGALRFCRWPERLAKRRGTTVPDTITI
jgi:hypothetical protein